MMRGWVRTATAVPPLHAGDPQANAKEIIQVLEEAETKEADVVVLPAFALTGATLGDLYDAPTLLLAAEEALEEIGEATKKKHPALVLSLPRRANGAVYEAIIIVQNGMVFETSDFTLVNRYDGSLLCRCTVAEAEDLESGTPWDIWQENGVDLVLIPAALPAGMGKASTLIKQVKALSARGFGIALASAGENETGLDALYGGDRLLAESGMLLAKGGTLGSHTLLADGVPAEAEGLFTLYADMDLDRLEGTRQQALEARGVEVEEEEDVETLPMTPRREAAWCAVDAAPMVAKTDEACEEVLQIQARALARRMRHVHTNQVWIGLSGGLDSTLAMLVSLRTFALENWDIKGIHLVSMPAFGTGKRTRSNASALGESSGCDFREISLTEVLTQHFQDIGLPKGDHSVAFENAQARERTQILMDLANLHGGLHVGTGDFSESALGWSTYNGDHMSMFNVNGAIAKTMAQALVRYEAKRLPTLRPILEDILRTPISPELLPDREGEIAQKTEDLIGPYEIHDFYLYYFLRYRYEPEKLLTLGEKAFAGRYDRKTLLWVMHRLFERFFASQFKRSVMTDGVDIGILSLSPRGGWEMPSDVGANAWLREVEQLAEEGEA